MMCLQIQSGTPVFHHPSYPVGCWTHQLHTGMQWFYGYLDGIKQQEPACNYQGDSSYYEGYAQGQAEAAPEQTVHSYGQSILTDMAESKHPGGA